MTPYVKLLLRLRLQSLNPFRYFGLDRTKKRTVFAAFGIMLYMLMMAGYLIWMEYHLFQAFVQLGTPETALALAVLASTLLILFTGFFYVFSELFFSKDVQLVSALPIPSRQILLAKLVRIWLSEALLALAICVPIIIMYGLHAGMNVLYYPAALLLTLTIPLLPLMAITLLSFVLIRISALWKHREALTAIMSVLLIVGILFVQMRWTNAVNSDMLDDVIVQFVQSQNLVLDMLSRLFPPAGWYSLALTGSGLDGLLYFLLFAGLNLGSLLVSVWLGKPYQQLAIRQGEMLVRVRAGSKRATNGNAVRSPLRALYRRELQEIIKSPSYALNSLAVGIVFPVLLVFFSMSGQGNMSDIAVLLPQIETLSVPVMIALFTAVFAAEGSMNTAISTSVSREGRRHEFFCTLPVPAAQILHAKLLLGLTVGLLCSLPTAIALAVLLPHLLPYIAVGAVMAIPFILCTSQLGLMLDTGHPKFGWRTETEAIKQNGMATLAMFGGMALIAACGFAFFLLMQQGLPPLALYMGICILAVLADLLLLRRLSTKTARTYLDAEIGTV